jgi:hypothetical protein
MKRVQSGVSVAVAIAALTVPLGATAATVNADLGANENFSDGFRLNPEGSQQYNFSVTQDLVISTFSVSGTGPENGEDLSTVTFGLMDPPENSFSDIDIEDDVSGANEFIPGAQFAAGENFSFFFEDGVDSGVGLTLSFDTGSPAPVPVPGAGALLFGALAGGGAWSRRRNKKG